MKLKVFSFDAARLRSTMAGAVPQIIIPDAVLCSEMGVHFSPCGRYLAACIACHVRSAAVSVIIDRAFLIIRLCQPPRIGSSALLDVTEGGAQHREIMADTLRVHTCDHSRPAPHACR